ncbi:M55 family metallopeptidase [Nonomuraea composti]|uniref:M55 family metallopeptidase n=1 Tax=Nonomuraea composti TaxID=2720023 RepID=UPI001F105022|nr:M55 family metallopeptidase [Nonomuraea sp. FMUSA5-5]
MERWDPGALTAETNAAVRGVHAFEPRAQVLVTEAHAHFRNLLPERLDRRAELLRGTPKPYGMMAGLHGGVDAALAAHAGVPPVLVSGDDIVAAEAAEVVPGMRAVVAKRALGAL